ncbi:hypothetical protein [Arthrospiribacter ruber]|uniref:Potassium transporter KefB n=1 Tax=Arthrospiribacter ruber TaxID=2487934 RepID=A0A951J5X9_9BACT|nr:hypothetical protein [Arthrospiribacter ruber]MBW3470402.1 hypothetical protein [Arthrospiribacter ruber]
MTPSAEFPKKQLVKNAFLSALFGAAIPLIGLTAMIITKEDQLELWMFFPLIIIPLGGGFGGAFFYLMGFYWFPSGNRKLVAIIFSTIFYFVALWISAVMAFAITGHWD